MSIAVLILAAAAAPDPVTAEQALEAYRAKLSLESARCPPQEDPEEIVVCGRREGLDPSRPRMAFPRAPGEVVHHINEPSPATEVFSADRCIERCRTGLNVSVDLIGLPGKLKRGWENLFGD